MECDFTNRNLFAMAWVYNTNNASAASNASTVLGLGVFLTLLSFTIISLRVYVRSSILRSVTIGKPTRILEIGLMLIVGKDDWIIVAAWVLSFVFVAITLARKDPGMMERRGKIGTDIRTETRWGLGLQDATDIPPQNVIHFGLVGSTAP